MTTLPPSPTIVTAVPVSRPRAGGNRAPPPGVQEGGVWGRGKHYGPKSGGITATLCIVGIFFWPACICALVPACAPCDEMDIYKVGNRFYNAGGTYLGSRENIREFVVSN